MSAKISLVDRIILKLVRQAMGCKVKWSKEELRDIHNKAEVLNNGH